MLEESGIESRLLWFDLALTYRDFTRQYDKAVMAFEKAQEISMERGGLWKYEDFYLRYGQALHLAGKHEKENEIFKLGLKLFPNTLNEREIYWNLSKCALSRAETTKANEYMGKYITAKRKLGQPQDNIEYWLGQVYSQTGMRIEAEKHFRNAYELNPQGAYYDINLARILIMGDINVSEGMALFEEILEQYPKSINSQYYKGLGHYKLGQYEESLELLKRAEELGRAADFYVAAGSDSLILAQIKQVEQALASQNQ